jgi:predicted HAD superfamily Cof-like phosphohydrolase
MTTFNTITYETKLTPYKQVKEFHETFGHPINNELQTDIFDNDMKLVNFRLSLINEEIKELNDAYKLKDKVEIIDALGDILYVVFGMCLVFGIDYDTYYDYNTTYDKNKKTNLDYFLVNDDTNFLMFLDMYFNNLKSSCENKNMSSVITQTCEIVLLIFIFCNSMNINIIEIFNEVHRSNMSKVCKTKEVAEKTVQYYLENEKRYEKPSYRLSNNETYYIVFDEKTGKILKSIYYETPQLLNFV